MSPEYYIFLLILGIVFEKLKGNKNKGTHEGAFSSSLNLSLELAPKYLTAYMRSYISWSILWGGNSAPEELHEIVGTHGRALLRSVPLDRALGTKSLVCIGLKQAKYFHLVARTNTKEVNRDRRTHCTNSWSDIKR